MSNFTRSFRNALQEMERAIGRRDSITMKGKAATQRQGPDMTESQLRKATTELKRSIRATKKEAQATDDRTEELDKYRAGLAEQLEHAGNECKALKEREQVLKKDVDVVGAWEYVKLGVLYCARCDTSVLFGKDFMSLCLPAIHALCKMCYEISVRNVPTFSILHSNTISLLFQVRAQ